MNPAGEQFGNVRLLKAIGHERSQPLQDSVDVLLRTILQWHGSEKPQDDISILAFEVSIPAHAIVTNPK
jgi:serine phosphatase RsbU (regulator of sigma subunit)